MGVPTTTKCNNNIQTIHPIRLVTITTTLHSHPMVVIPPTTTTATIEWVVCHNNINQDMVIHHKDINMHRHHNRIILKRPRPTADTRFLNSNNNLTIIQIFLYTV